MIENKTVAIFGGEGLIGKSFVKACLNHGANVIVLDKIKKNKINKNLDKNISYYYLDITKESSINKFFQLIKKKRIKLDAIINAAYPKSKKFGVSLEKLEYKNLKEDLSNQLGSSIILSKHAIKYFNYLGKGNIIFISSIQGFMAPKFSHYAGTNMTSPIEYSAIKAGIISITKYLAKYCKNDNIRINCISPGGIKNKQPDSFMKKYKNDCVSKGMLDPEDLNGALLMLISDYSKFITGQNIIIDDGWSL